MDGWMDGWMDGYDFQANTYIVCDSVLQSSVLLAARVVHVIVPVDTTERQQDTNRNVCRIITINRGKPLK